MNIFKKQLTSTSRKVLKKLFDESAIFKVDKMPLQAGEGDVGVLQPKKDGIRAKWLFDRNGIYNSLEQYNSFPRRVQEYIYHGDFLHSLRQRINIVHEMISCDLDTFMPVHYSIRPRDEFADQILDLDLKDPESVSKFYWVTHPGQTRAQASTFLQSELRNVLLYVNKKYLDNINIVSAGVNRIETPDELLDSYTPDFSVPEEVASWPNIYFDFNLPWHDDGLKRHHSNETFIAKCNNIFPDNELTEKRVSLHPTNKYSIGSFIEMDKFWRILFYSKLNVYTNLGNEAKFLFSEEFYKLVKVMTGNDSYRSSSVGQFIYTMGYDDYEQMESKNYHGELTAFNRLGSITQTYFTEEEKQYYESLLDEYKNFKISNTKLNFNIIDSDEKSFEEYVEMNAHSGLLIIANKKITGRTLADLLFCIPHNFTLSRSEDSKIAIINCHHTYWRSKENYREYIFSDKFFND